MNGIDWQVLFNIAVMAVMAMGGWIVGRVTKTLDQLDTDIRTLPEKYVSKADYRSDISEIKALLTGIRDKLDSKQDKDSHR
jgi:hypothetical protein